VGLDAEAISDEVESMWKMMYKLVRTFQDQAGPKRTAEAARNKIERFRTFIPLLQAVCNPGLRDRHWKQMSNLTGVQLKPTPESNLMEMINLGIAKFAPQLEEISGAATKEFQLEKNLTKMRTEWAEIRFECVPYRETGVNILSSLDDIQTLLDDHIIKVNTTLPERSGQSGST